MGRKNLNLDAKARPCSCRSEEKKKRMSEHTQEKATVEDKMVRKRRRNKTS